MSESPLKHTAEQYERVIEACQEVKRDDTFDSFKAAEEAFLALEPSAATARVTEMFANLHGSLDRMRAIIAELWQLKHRADREECLERQRSRR